MHSSGLSAVRERTLHRRRDRHAVESRQTRRYDRARGALDRNPTYIVATYVAVAGATGAR